ncbi:MAG: hypothetical protein ACRDF8_00830, partial [Chloroflexota bacterium]
MRGLLEEAGRHNARIYIPAGALAQVWRCGGRGQPISALLLHENVRVVALDEAAKAAGELCGRRGTSHLVDASVALCARITASIVGTSDPDDLRRLDARLLVAGSSL